MAHNFEAMFSLVFQLKFMSYVHGYDNLRKSPTQLPSGVPCLASSSVHLARVIIPSAHTRYLMLLPRYRREQSMWACLRLAWHGAIVEVGAIKLDRPARYMIRYAA